jgi:Domain of unknown function (DUF4166)
LRILIVGGYGVFGGRLAQLLADDARLTIFIAGRSIQSAQSFCAKLPAKAKMLPEHFDREGDMHAQLQSIGPDLVVDASGPFQGYGAAPYRLVAAATALGINYLDLADGSDFVRGISQFDAEAKSRGVYVLSGVSSFPVLTAAIVRHLGIGLARVDTITGGIAPSPYAGVGTNVIRAIVSYAGQPVSLTRDGKSATAYGLTETMRATICPPGQLPLGNRLFSLVDVPDLQLLPQHWPGLTSIWMGAGPVPEVLHRALIIMARGVRLGLVPPLDRFASVFYWVINTVRWGEHRGGMIVRICGTTDQGVPVERSWHMLAEGSDGPLIPSMAVATIVQRSLDGRPPWPGARPATNELELADYDAQFARRMITTGVRQTPTDEQPQTDAQPAPLYQRVLGSAWDGLPLAIRAMHSPGTGMEARGRADIDRGGHIVARLLASLFGFPPAARDVPVSVYFKVDALSETWVRTFGSNRFASHQSAGTGRAEYLINERFGPFTFGLALVRSPDRLSLVVRRWTFLGVPLPATLAPFGDTYETVEGNRFRFHVEIRLPLIGLLVRYRGWLVPEKAVAAVAQASESMPS